MEFLVDNDGHYYFIEMNTRIQVEHTITEEVYGCDLVKEQILIASGERLSPHVAHAEPRLHAIQCRINAEDPERNFQPSPGRIAFYYAPGGRGVRVDSHAYTGYIVPPYYDSMIAKLITIGATRTSAIARMRRALDEYYITGIKTTVPFHSAIMRNAEFRNGTYDTGFVERLMNGGELRVEADAGPLARIAARLTAADLSRCRLYGILDLGYVEIDDAPQIARALLAGGVDLIQLRAKNHSPAAIRKPGGRGCTPLRPRRGVPLIINDYPEIARSIQAGGSASRSG